MVRQVADKLASLFRDENIKVICVLGGPYVGKTWLVNHILETEKCNGIKVFDNGPSTTRDSNPKVAIPIALNNG